MNKQNLVYSVRSNDETLIGAYLGIWTGDGTQYHDKGYTVKICCHSKDKKMHDFFKFVLSTLFGKITVRIVKENGNRTLLKFKSKFIFYFVLDYMSYHKNKTHTVNLKKDVHTYSDNFLQGFILGLALTDGYLKKNFVFNTTSEGLANNVLDILRMQGFNPRIYIHDRRRYVWKNLHMIKLNRTESRKMLAILDSTITRTGYSFCFKELKYGGDNGPAEI